MHTGFVISELDSGRFHTVARALVRGELLRRHGDDSGGHRSRGRSALRGRIRRGPGRHATPVRNDGELPVRWAEMQAPMPRSAYQDDTFLVPPAFGR